MKQLVGNCPYETRKYVDSKTGELCSSPIKCIAKSNPLFQEFRLWQFLSNLRIYADDGTNADVTSQYLAGPDDWTRLFEWLNDKKEIDQSTLLKKYFGFKEKGGRLPFRWNYVVDKKYPCNKTRAAILAKWKSDFFPSKRENMASSIFS